MLPNSTERAVTVSGTAEAVTACIQVVCNIMLEVSDAFWVEACALWVIEVIWVVALWVQEVTRGVALWVLSMQEFCKRKDLKDHNG